MDENDRGMGTWRIYLVLDDSARVRPPVRPRHLCQEQRIPLCSLSRGWLVLIYYEKKILLVGASLCVRKILLTGCNDDSARSVSIKGK